MSDASTGAMGAQVAMNTVLAAAIGGIAVFAMRYVITKMYKVGGLSSGIPLRTYVRPPATDSRRRVRVCALGALRCGGHHRERHCRGARQRPADACCAFVMASFISPVVVAWTWGYRWISAVGDIGYIDFACSGIVRLTGGVSALLAPWPLGRARAPGRGSRSLTPTACRSWCWARCPSGPLRLHAGTGAMGAQVAMNIALAAATGGTTVFAVPTSSPRCTAWAACSTAFPCACQRGGECLAHSEAIAGINSRAGSHSLNAWPSTSRSAGWGVVLEWRTTAVYDASPRSAC